MAKADSKNTNTLDVIIRELTQNTKQADEPEYQTVIIEKESGEIVESVPYFSWKSYRYFHTSRKNVASNIKGPEVTLKYSSSNNPIVVSVIYSARITERSTLKLVRFVNGYSTPVEAINSMLYACMSGYIFETNDFVSAISTHRENLIELLILESLKIGLDLKPTLNINIEMPDGPEPDGFISFEHPVEARTMDAQAVVIKHTITLTLSDPIAFRLADIKDIKAWARTKLEQYTHNAIIEMRYAEVLVSMQDSIIKNPMHLATKEIGYELKQLVTVPGLEIEKFYFETADDGLYNNREYGTKDPRFKVAINVIINGRLDLYHEKTKQYIKPSYDIIAYMKKNVVEYTRLYFNEITPDDCFSKSFEIEGLVVTYLKTKLEESYGFNELGVTIKFLENNLSERLSHLREKRYKVDFWGDFMDKKFSLWFRVDGIAPDGWYPFRINNYTDTDTELEDIARMIKNGMSSIFRPQSIITGELIGQEFGKIHRRVCKEFGLDIKIHDFYEDVSDEEQKYIDYNKRAVDEQDKQNRLLQVQETKDLENDIKAKELYLQAGYDENSEQIKNINKRLAESEKRNKPSKTKFLKQKTDINFLSAGLDDKGDNILNTGPNTNNKPD